MSAIPHPVWCDPVKCFATDVDGEGAHVSAPTEFRGTGSFPLYLTAHFYRVDSAMYGHPWIEIVMAGAQPGRAMARIADVRRLARVLLDLADSAEAAEQGAGS